MAFAGAIIILVIAIPAYGYYATFIAPPRRVVFSINGVEHTLGEVSKLTRANVAASGGAGGEVDLSSLPLQILNNLVNNELVIQGAPGLGVVVTQDEVDAEIQVRFYPRPREGEQTDTPALEREFDENFRQYLDVTQFSDDEYREIVKSSLLRGKIQELVSEQVPQLHEQVYVHWIRVADETAIQAVQAGLDQGEAFDRLARVHAIDDLYADDNGEVGWVPRGAFSILDSTLFSLERDAVSEPVLRPPDTYFIKVTDGPELREVSEEMLILLKVRAMERWTDDQLGSNDIFYDFSDGDYAWVINQVRELISSDTP